VTFALATRCRARAAEAVNPTLADATLNVAVDIAVVGSASNTLADATLNAVASAAIAAALRETLDNASLVSDGSVASSEVTSDLSVTLANASIASTAAARQRILADFQGRVMTLPASLL
jgi:hypothetical protein